MASQANFRAVSDENTNESYKPAAPRWYASGPAQYFKDYLVSLGRFCPNVFILFCNSCLHFLEAGRLMAQMGVQLPKRVVSADDLFVEVSKHVGDRRLLYLEFGVYEGDRIRSFSRLIKSPSAIFHGFDSFVGLPERWKRSHKKGFFSTSGQIPNIPDARVKFFKGWFNETLSNYELPPHDILFVNIDADLYSSANSVLTALKNEIKVGSFLYFDEFYDRNNELKAFEEFVENTGFKFECLMATKGLSNVLLRRVV